MSLFNARTFTVYREATGSWAKGKWTPGSESSFTVTGTWQPTPGNRLSVLPEGKRSVRTYTLYTSTELQGADQPDVAPDIVEADGERYDVITVAPWQNALIPHYECLCQRVLEGQS